MEDSSIDSMLQSFNKKEDDTWLMNVMQLNMDCIIALQKQKARSVLKPAKWIKVFAVLLGIIWVLFLGFLLWHSMTVEKIFFIISAGFIMIATAIAVVVYIKHLVLIWQINNSDSITKTQLKLAKLQTSTLQITRILFLQAPFYTTWFITKDMFLNAGTGLQIFQISITAVFSFLAIWLYRNISYKNKDKKWFRILFNSPEWTSVSKAMAFIQEIDDFKNDR